MSRDFWILLILLILFIGAMISYSERQKQEEAAKHLQYAQNMCQWYKECTEYRRLGNLP
jgi:hypothetical protein